MELCSFVYFIYLTKFLFYVKNKKKNRRTSSLVLGISSRRSPSGFVRCEGIVRDRPIPNSK